MDKKMLKFVGRGLLLAATLTGTVAEAVEPTEYQLGDAGTIAPHLRFEFGNDNNPLRADEGSQEAAFLRLQPSVSYLAQRRNNQLTIGYEGDFYEYFQDFCPGEVGVSRPGDCLPGSTDIDTASYQDHAVRLNGFLEVTSRVRARLRLSNTIQHQPLGTGLSTNRDVLDELTSPDDWRRTRASAELSYGASQARGELRGGLRFIDQELRTERDVNLDAQSDTTVEPYAQLLYRVGTRTQLFTGISQARVRDGISFTDGGQVIQNLERDITRLSFGAELADSSVTSGSVSVIAVSEDFLASGRQENFIAWDINLIWRPLTFSTVTINGGRETETGVFDDDISLTTNLGVNWVHFWRERFSSRVQFDYTINDDLDESLTADEIEEEEDTIITFRVEGNYNIRRWLDIGGFLRIDTRDGNTDDRDFERTVIGITANGSI